LRPGDQPGHRCGDHRRDADRITHVPGHRRQHRHRDQRQLPRFGERLGQLPVAAACRRGITSDRVDNNIAR
jgi:hypothetical protein